MPFAHVFNMSLLEGIVPLGWKEANAIPLFEKLEGARARTGLCVDVSSGVII